MTEIVLEETWHTAGTPRPGDYIQLELHHDISREVMLLEDFVIDVKEDGTIDLLASIPDSQDWAWERWRRGALPDYRSVLRMEEVDA